MNAHDVSDDPLDSARYSSISMRIRQHTHSIRQHTMRAQDVSDNLLDPARYSSRSQLTSAYVSIRQHTSEFASMRALDVSDDPLDPDRYIP